MCTAARDPDIAVGDAIHRLSWLRTAQGQSVLASVWGDPQRRPICRCVAAGVPMYVARRNQHFYLARMPGSGPSHAMGCPSIEVSEALPPRLFCGAACYGPQTLWEAEDGGMRVRLGVGAASLEGLLDLLIESADLHRFWPGERSSLGWAGVRERLQGAAQSISIDEVGPLPAVLLLPAPFDKERAAVLDAAHSGFLEQRDALRLVCAPLRVPSRATAFGWALRLKHLPNFVFWLPKAVAAAWLARQPQAFDLDGLPERMLMLARVVPARGTGFRIVDLAGRRIDARCMPCASDAECQVAESLASEGRAFFRPLRFDCRFDETLADFALLDGEKQPYPLFVLSPIDRAAADRAKARLAKRLSRFPHCASIWDGDNWSPPLPPSAGAPRC